MNTSAEPSPSGGTSPEPLSGDRPVGSQSEDRLGFAPLAARLASALANQAATEGFVVGVEGRWGSGKSSLLKLTREALEALPEAARPIVVDFRPWLVGDRDALLGALFRRLATEIERIELQQGASTTQDLRKRRELTEKLRTYSARAEVFSSALAALPVIGPWAKLAARFAKAGKEIDTKVPLEQLKGELDEALGKLPRRVVITIDDVDRLEPTEVVELLRLVRSVADFRNVIYLLCYDGSIVARSIEAGLKVEDGRAYLEKIVQAVVPVPVPEAFQLRRWLEEALSPMAAGASEDVRDRLRAVVDRTGGRWLTTPRSVVRVLNAIRLLTPGLQDEIDLPDLVWLQLIRTSQPDLFRWIEAYSVDAAANSYASVSVSDETKKRFFSQLQSQLTAAGIDFGHFRFELAEHLPGITPLGWDKAAEKPPLFGPVDAAKVERNAQGRRLASPDHYRLYFALSQPRLSARTSDFTALLAAAEEGAAEVAELLHQWAGEQDPALGSKLDIMLDRLSRGGGAGVDSLRATRILRALADELDALGSTQSRNVFGSPGVWGEAERTLPVLRDAIPEAERAEVFAEIFERGRALGWLTTVLRSEVFGHGRFGARRAAESEWLLSEKELDVVIKKMIDRYRSMALEDFAQLPNPLSALFAWAQAGDEAAARELVDKEIIHDEGLVRVLESMTGQVNSSNRGIYVTLSRENVGPFLDYDRAYQRLEEIAKSGPQEMRPRAVRLVQYFQDARDF